MVRWSTRAGSFAVIGCGTIGGLRAHVAAEHPAVDALVLFDVDSAKANKLAGDLGPIASVADSLDAAVEQADVAGVFVSTSEDQHTGPATTAIRAGKHVLVEKPLADNLSDATALLTAAEAAGVALYVAYTQRFRRRFLNAKEQIDVGKLGGVTGILGKRYNGRAVRDKIAKRTDKVTPASDSLTYVVDLSLWYLQGATPMQVVARSNYFEGPDHTRRPEASWALLEMDNGAICNLSVAWQLPTMHPTAFVIGLDVFGDRGFLSIDDSHSEVVMSTELGADLLYTPDVHPQAVFVGTTPAGEWARTRFWGPLHDETGAFIEAVLCAEPHPVLATGRDACRVLAVTEAIDVAAATRGVAEVNPGP